MRIKNAGWCFIWFDLNFLTEWLEIKLIYKYFTKVTVISRVTNTYSPTYYGLISIYSYEFSMIKGFLQKDVPKGYCNVDFEVQGNVEVGAAWKQRVQQETLRRKL